MQALLEYADVAPVLSFLDDHVVVAPLVGLLAVVALLLSGPVSGRLGVGRFAAALLVLACTAPFAMTLTPSSATPEDRTGDCVMALRPVSDWGRGGEELANVLLTVPAALLLVVLLPRGGLAPALLLAVGAPPLVEALQLGLPSLGRLCEVTDVVLNLLGLVIGLGLGLPVRLLRRSRRRRAART